MIAAKHRTIGHIDFRSAIGFHLHTDNVAGVDNRDTKVINLPMFDIPPLVLE